MPTQSASAIVVSQPITCVAGHPQDLLIYALDGIPQASGQYTITVTQAGSAGNGTVNAALVTVDEVEASG